MSGSQVAATLDAIRDRFKQLGRMVAEGLPVIFPMPVKHRAGRVPA